MFYNFWRDEKHVQGIWRKTTLDSYKSGKNVKWEVRVCEERTRKS